MTRLIYLLLVPVLIAFTGNSFASNDLDIDQLQARVYSTIDKVAPAVVSIVGQGSAFSGVIVSPEGHVLSAGHAVQPGQRYRVSLPDGRRLSATGMGASTRLDCALLQINRATDLPHVPMGDSSQLVSNQPCLSLSYPGGQGRGTPIVRFGYIKRSRSGQSLIQSTALMEPGDSGGPLFDLNGNVIGIHSRIGRSMDRNYEVPIDTYKKYWEQLNFPEKFTSTSGPPVPKLGFEGEVKENVEGILVYGLVKNGLAEKAGLKVDDIIIEIQGHTVDSLRRVRSALTAAYDSDVKELKVTFRRDDKSQTVTIPFQKPEKIIPPFERLADKKESLTPQPISELADFPNYFAKIESQLDDNCAIVTSSLGGKPTRILGTFLAGTSNLVSKSSMVGTEPFLMDGENRIGLEVVARDDSNDLVLLKSGSKNKTGVALEDPKKNQRNLGRFLLSPDPDGAGLVSVLSRKEFVSRKQASKGYLGVILSTFENRGVVLDEVRQGAAQNAGLKTGDVITRMNETDIRTRTDMLRFLARMDPQKTVKANVERGEEKLAKEITLGALLSGSNHAADMMEKSGRRDGFSQVIAHDAILAPDECGGPLYDIEGNFVGLNIARNSRVRSFAIPLNVIRSFVEPYAK